jgi:hypothetical protein
LNNQGIRAKESLTDNSETGTFQVSVSGASGGEPVGEESFGDPVVYANNTATVMGNVNINGEAAGAGDVVAIYVGVIELSKLVQCFR